MREDDRLGKKKKIIVCADDFGISCAVNQAILELIRLNRISAVSCLVSADSWNQGFCMLREYRGRIDIGLHLFYGEPFRKTLISAYLRLADRRHILEEFRKQLNIFYKDMGFYPDFIDGHEHIHQLPVFRSALLELANSVPAKEIYLRNSCSALNRIIERKVSVLKNMLISLPGRSMKKILLRQGLFTNSDFLGLYDFKSAKSFRDIFVSFLKVSDPRNSIYVVHPADEDSSKLDQSAFSLRRIKEASYLKSDTYINDLKQAGFTLSRFEYVN